MENNDTHTEHDHDTMADESFENKRNHSANDHQYMEHEIHEHNHDSPHADHRGHHNHHGMALSATLHCLTGCAIGEILGMIIGVSLGLSSMVTIVLAISLAFVFGYTLSMVPLIQNGISLKRALKLVLIADTLSIAAMEAAENLVMFFIPGAMDSGVGNPLFWISMTLALFAGFAVAYPVNKHLLAKGKGHAITHGEIGHHEMNNKPLIFGLTAFMLGGFIVAVMG